MFLNEDVFSQIKDIDYEKEIRNKLKDVFNHCAEPIYNEYIARVLIELYDENDPKCSQSIKNSSQPIINPHTLGVWKKDYI